MLMNYIALQKDIPLRMHFSDHYYVDRVIPDKESGKNKIVKSLVFWVDRVDGDIAARTFSVLSERLYALLFPYLADFKHREYEFTITKTGEGYLTEFQVSVEPFEAPKALEFPGP